MKEATFSPRHLPAVVRFWNRAFATRRNFFPVTERLFRERVVDKETAVEKFEPKGFILALDGKEVVGLLHAGIRPEALCKVLDPSWRGGRQGYIAFLFVEPAYRKKGIGTVLWHRGLEFLGRTRQVVLDGQVVNPFYGNSEGPFTPFWGTPEGIGVQWDDSATKKFLARKGFAPRFKGVQLALDLASAAVDGTEAAEKAAARQGFAIRFVVGAYPELGEPEAQRRAVTPGLDYEVVAAVRDGRTAGLLSYFPMREVRPGLYGIYEAMVVEELRGKALGRRLLEAAVGRMRRRGGDQVEVLTLPELSPSAHKLYVAGGFRPAVNWAVY